MIKKIDPPYKVRFKIQLLYFWCQLVQTTPLLKALLSRGINAILSLRGMVKVPYPFENVAKTCSPLIYYFHCQTRSM